MLEIPNEIEKILEKLEKNGFEAYTVGGCVRDMLLNRTPHDFDITTNAQPNDIREIFEKTVPTGIEHGTVTVITDGIPTEVTTYRTEGNYTDRRRPDSVTFISSLKEDLSRRDFTVNAMAYSPLHGLKDYFGGAEDLNRRLLRTVGEPKKRFEEDALRILRLFRFSSVLNFKCEEKTLGAALKFSDTLKSVSVERIFSELYKCINGVSPSALHPLISHGGLDFCGIFSEPDYRAIEMLQNPDLRLFSFLHLSGCDIPQVLKLFKASNKFKYYCEVLSSLCDLPLPKTKPEIKEILCKFEPSCLSDMLEFKKAAYGTNTDTAERLLNEILTDGEPYLLSHLALNGNDLRKYGLCGKEIGKALSKLQSAIILSPEVNRPEKLYEILKSDVTKIHKAP